MVCEILIRGLRYTDEGYDFLSKVPNYLNKDKFIYELPWEEYDKLLSQEPVFDRNLPYIVNNHKYRLSKKHKSEILIGVYVYDLNFNLIGTYGGQLKTAKYFNVTKHQIVSHLDKNKIFLCKYYLSKSPKYPGR